MICSLNDDQWLEKIKKILYKHSRYLEEYLAYANLFQEIKTIGIETDRCLMQDYNLDEIMMMAYYYDAYYGFYAKLLPINTSYFLGVNS